MNLDYELQIAETAARQAGEVILKTGFKQNVQFKPENAGPVSQADLNADAIIREILSASFPQDLIVTEETFTGFQIPKTGRVWFIDPIDGTAYFIKGDKEYSVMIGLVIDGYPVLGVVFQPLTETLWRAIDTRKLEINNPVVYSERLNKDNLPVKLDITNKVTAKNGPVAVISGRQSSKFIEFLSTELKVSKVIKQGSIGLKMALIAEGKANFYIAPTRKIKLWDTAAPSVILCAAGGKITTISGDNLVFSGSIEHGVEICAATVNCHKWLQKQLPIALQKWNIRN